jgi:hypothetical protein
MDEFHLFEEVFNVYIYHITSLSNDKFHKEQTWACLDIVNETHASFPWHLIGS